MQLHEHYRERRGKAKAVVQFAEQAKKFNILLCYTFAKETEETRRYTLAKLLLTLSCKNIMAEIPPDRVRFEVEQALLLSPILQNDVTNLEGRLAYPIETTL